MDFNWGNDNAPMVVSGSGIGEPDAAQQATTTYTTILTPTNNFGADVGYSAGVYTAVADNQLYTISFSLPYGVISSTAWTFTYRWKHVHASGGADTYPALIVTTGTGLLSPFAYLTGTFSVTLMNGDTLTPEFKSVDYPGTEVWTVFGALSGAEVIVSTSSNAISSSAILHTLRGELGQWDFLKGIMTMFNLVSMIDENNPNNILIEPYNDVFVTNPLTKELDWSDKVDVSEMSLSPLTDLNKNTIFKFVEDDEDYTFMRYKFSTSGHLYGSKELDASISGTTNGRPTVLQGTEEIVAEPFAATVSKQLESQYFDFIVPTIYAVNDDLSSEGFDNSPRIFYKNGVKDLVSCTYHVPAQNGGGTVGAEDEFLQFSHLSAIPSVSPTTKDFVFESNQLFTGVGNPPIDNLFNSYWDAYFTELYHPDTRTMMLKVNLNPSDIATFKFYDKVFIRNRIFRVNKIEYKPNSLAKVEFILIP